MTILPRIRKHIKKEPDTYTLATSLEDGHYFEDSSPSPKEPIAEMGWEDKKSIFLLLVLYTLQGIPLGLSGSIPIMMKEYGASYQSLSMFSLVSLPFSLKLLWAPLVDSLYIKSIGRRKTWLIPVQIICGLVMIYGSYRINYWMTGVDDASKTVAAPPNAVVLTGFFFLLYILMATQDITVDGWALTMLSRANVGYASSCNAIGQVLGVFLANQGFIALSDIVWCKRYLGMDTPLIDLPGFMRFWGILFVVLTIIIAVTKREIPVENEDEPDGLYATYMQVIGVFKLKPVQLLCLVLITARISFGPNDAVSMFKFQEYGMPKADIAVISPIFLVLSLTLPAVTSSYFADQPLLLFQGGILLKVITSFLMWCMFQLSVIEYADGIPTISFYVLLIIVMSLNELSGNIIFGAQMTFFAQIADPAIGGTYMTLLNTVSNLGSKWPSAVALWLLPMLTYSSCMKDGATVGNDCVGNKSDCEAAGGRCEVTLDGYTIQIISCLVIGLIWVLLARKPLHRIEQFSSVDWLTVRKSR